MVDHNGEAWPWEAFGKNGDGRHRERDEAGQEYVADLMLANIARYCQVFGYSEALELLCRSLVVVFDEADLAKADLTLELGDERTMRLRAILKEM